MLSINNIFSPAHGGPIIAPNQDIVLGCYFLTLIAPGEQGEGKMVLEPRRSVDGLFDGRQHRTSILPSRC